jgi:hypothetical protein
MFFGTGKLVKIDYFLLSKGAFETFARLGMLPNSFECTQRTHK